MSKNTMTPTNCGLAYPNRADDGCGPLGPSVAQRRSNSRSDSVCRCCRSVVTPKWLTVSRASAGVARNEKDIEKEFDLRCERL